MHQELSSLKSLRGTCISGVTLQLGFCFHCSPRNQARQYSVSSLVLAASCFFSQEAPFPWLVERVSARAHAGFQRWLEKRKLIRDQKTRPGWEGGEPYILSSQHTLEAARGVACATPSRSPALTALSRGLIEKAMSSPPSRWWQHFAGFHSVLA